MNHRKLAVLLLLCLLFSGCTRQKEEAPEQKDKTISELAIPGLASFCVDEAGEFYYYAANGDSTIYQCAMDGTPVAQFAITADAEAPENHGGGCEVCLSGQDESVRFQQISVQLRERHAGSEYAVFPIPRSG